MNVGRYFDGHAGMGSILLPVAMIVLPIPDSHSLTPPSSPSRPQKVNVGRYFDQAGMGSILRVGDDVIISSASAPGVYGQLNPMTLGSIEMKYRCERAHVLYSTQ